MSELTEKETLLKDIANAEKSRLAAEADGNFSYAEKLQEGINADKKRLLPWNLYLLSPPPQVIKSTSKLFDYDICIYLRFNFFLADIEAAVKNGVTQGIANYLAIISQTEAEEISLLKSLNKLWNGESK